MQHTSLCIIIVIIVTNSALFCRECDYRLVYLSRVRTYISNLVAIHIHHASPYIVSYLPSSIFILLYLNCHMNIIQGSRNLYVACACYQELMSGEAAHKFLILFMKSVMCIIEKQEW